MFQSNRPIIQIAYAVDDIKKSAELEKASQLTEDLSKKLLTSENINREAKKEIESLINYVKNN